ncbi:MAG: DUF2225 domain-containing protein [Bacillota bacterium]
MIKLGALRNLKRIKKYQQGSILESANNATIMYVVIKGEIGVYLNYRKQNQKLLYTIGSGDFFGEAALFLKKSPRTYSVAHTEVYALPVDAANINAFWTEEPGITFELFKALCARLDAVSAAYEKLAGQPFVDPQSASPAQGAKRVLKAELEKSKAAKTIEPNPDFSLFPDGHGKYELNMDSADRVYLMDKSYTCPACRHDFHTLKVKASKLLIESTDIDMRNRYRGVEPLYFDVVTCPNCLYSALGEMFTSPDKPYAELPEEVQALQGNLNLPFELCPEPDSIFAGYYLALLCAPKFFVKHSSASAKLLLKLSRIYQDCGDTEMELFTAQRALDAYLYVYENVEISPSQEQHLCIVMAELYAKLGDIKRARDFFYKAKTNRNGSALLKNHADKRIFDLRDPASSAEA